MRPSKEGLALSDALKILYGVTVPLSDLLEAKETISFLSRNSTTEIAFLVPQQTAMQSISGFLEGKMKLFPERRK